MFPSRRTDLVVEVSMLLVIFYCGLIPFVVFARPANNPSPTDTGNNNDARLIVGKSTNTTNADNGIDCAPQINENDITNIVERTESDQVNIIDFRFFDGEGQDQRLFEDMKITLVTLVGREILLILSNMGYSYITLTLNAGRENRDVHFKNASLKNCNEKHIALSILKQIVLRIENPKSYEVCYGETEDAWHDSTVVINRYPTEMTFHTQTYSWVCCRITNTDLTNFQHVCLERNPFLQGFLVLLTILTIISLPFYYSRLLRKLLSRSFFQIIHPQYYKLQESTLSLTDLLLRIVWDEQGCICVSIARRCVMALLLIGNIYLCVSQAFANDKLWFLFIFCVLFSTAVFYFTIKGLMRSWGFERDQIEIALLMFRQFPFNFYPESRIKSLLLFPVSVLCLFFTSFAFIVFIRHEYNVKIFKSCFPRFFLSFDTLVAYGFAIFQFNTYHALTYALQFFLLGLFLNLAYFLPYLAAISVFTFYFYGTWKSLEQKYFLLKLLIYEECQARKPDTNENETLPEQDQEIHRVAIVPKEIYDSIRKELLPYDKSLFWVVLQLLWLLVLSYGVSELVRMLRAFNTTATIKVLATASVGILPHMFNTIFWNAKGGDGKEPWKKELKENVKRLVETLPIHKIVLSLPASSEAERNSESGEQQQNDDNDEPQNVENDEPQNVENAESQNVQNAEPQNVENDEPQNVENDEPQNVENDEPQNVKNTEPQNVENDEPQNVENDEPQNVENDEPQNVENAEPQNVKNTEPQNVENAESQNVENAEPQNVENAESQNVENAEPQNVENAESQNVENAEPQNVENDEPQIDENDEHARLLTSHKDEDIHNEIGYVLKLLVG